MRYKILICLFILTVLRVQGQNFGAGHPCNVNVNQSQGFRDIVKRATFKITFVGPAAGNCTGTLVNRDINQNELGFYFIIARHCLIDRLYSANRICWHT
jgi:hypothetical protein